MTDFGGTVFPQWTRSQQNKARSAWAGMHLVCGNLDTTSNFKKKEMGEMYLCNTNYVYNQPDLVVSWRGGERNPCFTLGAEQMWLGPCGSHMDGKHGVKSEISYRPRCVLGQMQRSRTFRIKSDLIYLFLSQYILCKHNSSLLQNRKYIIYSEIFPGYDPWSCKKYEHVSYT